jgi:hypothetical protein
MLTPFLKSISYLFHPLLMPWMAAVYYFTVTTHQYSPLKISYWLISIIILSVLLPLVLYFILNKLEQVQTIHLKTSKERIWPLGLNSMILGYLCVYVFPESICIELHYFFLGIVVTILTGLVLALLKFKSSIHMMSASSAFFFIILLNLHYGYSFSSAFVVFVIMMGAMASSRLHLNAHTVRELVIGLIIGVIPQLLFLKDWL